MKRIICLVLIILLVFLVACYRIDSIEQYVGEYAIEANYKNTYHYYYGSKKLVSDARLIENTFTLKIEEDGSVLVTYQNGEVANGKVSCTEEEIKFYGIPYLSSYTFKYSDSSGKVILDYSHIENKIGFEYDYQSERFTLIKKKTFSQKDEYVYKAITAELTVTAIYETYKNVLRVDKDYNKLIESSLMINMVDNTYVLEGPKGTQFGTFEITNGQYVFYTDSDEALIPNDQAFVYEDYEENYLHLTLTYKKTIQEEDYLEEYTYQITFITSK